MSRSYKKNPFVTDHRCGTTKELKRLANRTVRRHVNEMEDMPSRLPHKKMTETWDIHDYSWRMTREEAIEWYRYQMEHKASEYFKKRFPTLEAWLNYWEKCHRRK